MVFDLVSFKEPDKNSCYYQIFKMGRYTHDVLVDDILACLHIGFITLCPTIIAAVKHLKEQKEIADKLKKAVRISLETELENHKETSKKENKAEEETQAEIKEEDKENSEISIIEVL